jgi:hypothetical protein
MQKHHEMKQWVFPSAIDNAQEVLKQSQVQVNSDAESSSSENDESFFELYSILRAK